MTKFLINLLGIPKIVIAFHSSGCMAHNHIFNWIGFVIREWKSESDVDNYECRILKMSTSPFDWRDEHFDATGRAWQIQHLVFNIYLFVD